MNYILITGASSGIGEGVAMALSQDNKLVLCGRNREKLEIVRKKCSSSSDHLILCCDLATQRMDIFKLLSTFLLDNNIVIEKVVHCAGCVKILPLKNFIPQYVDEIFNTNLFSIIEILRVLLKRDNKGGLKNIVLISGLWSVRGDVGNSIYAASKGALNSLVYTLAQELAPKVRINAISPGAVLTPMSEQLLSNDDFRNNILKDYPLGLGAVEDVVNYIVFLLSDKSRWVTGQNIIIDGGRSTK